MKEGSKVSVNMMNVDETTNPRHFVFSSIAAVYGISENIPIKETAYLKPEIPMAAQTHVEDILADCERAWGVKSAILPHYNLAGVHPSGEIGDATEPESYHIPLILQAAAGKKNLW